MYLGRRQARLTTSRPIRFSLLVACAAVALAVPDVSAGMASTVSNAATPLWREYPLERTAMAAAGAALPSTQSTGRASESPAPEPGARTPWIVYLLTGVAVALTVATAVVLRRNAAADRSPAVFFDERTLRAAAATVPGAAPTKNLAGRNPRRDRQRGAVVPERRASEEDRQPAEATRRREAPARTAPALTRGPEAPDSRTAGTEQTAVPPPVAPSATEHSADMANVVPAVPQAPSAPQHRTQADAESAPTATPAHAADRDPQRKGSRASAAPRERSRQGSGASRSGAPPPRPATSDDAARTAPGRTRPRRNKPAAAQSARADSAAVETDKSRTGAAVRGPICQIRWRPTGRGSCFSAVTTDASGVERTVATSPRVEWHRATPPEQSPEARAALRQLAKTLRDNGWKPMRAKGKDFNEPQWYARRFRGPEAPAQ